MAHVDIVAAKPGDLAHGHLYYLEDEPAQFLSESASLRVIAPHGQHPGKCAVLLEWTADASGLSTTVITRRQSGRETATSVECRVGAGGAASGGGSGANQSVQERLARVRELQKEREERVMVLGLILAPRRSLRVNATSSGVIIEASSGRVIEGRIEERDRNQYATTDVLTFRGLRTDADYIVEVRDTRFPEAHMFEGVIRTAAKGASTEIRLNIDELAKTPGALSPIPNSPGQKP